METLNKLDLENLINLLNRVQITGVESDVVTMLKLKINSQLKTLYPEVVGEETTPETETVVMTEEVTEPTV